MKATKGTIEEVSTHGEAHEFCIVIGPHGIEEDRSGTPGILLLNAEVPHFLNREYGMQIQAGQLGDNILVEGVDNLSSLKPGSTIVIDNDLVLIVEGHARHYQERFPNFPKVVLNYLEEWCGATCMPQLGERQPLRRVCNGQEVVIQPKIELKGAA